MKKLNLKISKCEDCPYFIAGYDPKDEEAKCFCSHPDDKRSSNIDLSYSPTEMYEGCLLDNDDKDIFGTFVGVLQ